MRPISQVGKEDGISSEAGYRAGEQSLEPHIGFKADAVVSLGTHMVTFDILLWKNFPRKKYYQYSNFN